MFLLPLIFGTSFNAVIFILMTGCLVALLVIPARERQEPATRTAQELLQRFDSVHLMNGTQFEYFMADLFKAMGYRTSVLGGAGDQGVDILLTKGDQKIVVQCKNYAKPVGNRLVQEVYTGSTYHGGTEAWVVAPRGYTSGAVELAKRANVQLYDARTIRGWINQLP